MPPNNSRVAFCEDFNEDSNDIVPDTRREASLGPKTDGIDPSQHSHVADGGSDSGYSSRTGATAVSGDSIPSSKRSPMISANEIDSDGRDSERLRRREVKDKKRSKSRVRDKDSQDRRSTSSSHNSHITRPGRVLAQADPPKRPVSRARRRDSNASRHAPGICWACDRLGYHPPQPTNMPPMDPMQMDYSAAAYAAQMAPPPSPQAYRYPPVMSQDPFSQGPIIQPEARTRRSNSQAAQSRPMSFHGGMMQDMSRMYMQPIPGYTPGYDHGPPLSASAYSHAHATPSYMRNPYVVMSPGISNPRNAAYDAIKYRDRPRAHSATRSDPHPDTRFDPRIDPRTERARVSRPEKPHRRPSTYGTPVIEHAPAPSRHPDEGHGDRRSSREVRARRQSVSSKKNHDDEDYYREIMPPPPKPATKSKTSPDSQIIPARRPSVRKASTTSNATPPVNSRTPAFDVSDLHDALDQSTAYYVRPSYSKHRDPEMVERRSSVSSRSRPRPPSYHSQYLVSKQYHPSSRYSVYDHDDYEDDDDESGLSEEDAAPPARISIESNSSRRRRPSVVINPPSQTLEQKQKEIKEYQEARATTTPFPREALQPLPPIEPVLGASDTLDEPGMPGMPGALTLDSLSRRKAGSESGSDKSRSDSSRGDSEGKVSRCITDNLSNGEFDINVRPDTGNGITINLKFGSGNAANERTLTIAPPKRNENHYLLGNEDALSSTSSIHAHRREIEDVRPPRKAIEDARPPRREIEDVRPLRRELEDVRVPRKDPGEEVRVPRREFEEFRRFRDDRTERMSRRSSRSGYSGRGLLD